MKYAFLLVKIFPKSESLVIYKLASLKTNFFFFLVLPILKGLLHLLGPGFYKEEPSLKQILQRL